MPYRSSKSSSGWIIHRSLPWFRISFFVRKLLDNFAIGAAFIIKLFGKTSFVSSVCSTSEIRRKSADFWTIMLRKDDQQERWYVARLFLVHYGQNVNSWLLKIEMISNDYPKQEAINITCCPNRWGRCDLWPCSGRLAQEYYPIFSYYILLILFLFLHLFIAIYLNLRRGTCVSLTSFVDFLEDLVCKCPRLYKKYLKFKFSNDEILRWKGRHRPYW